MTTLCFGVYTDTVISPWVIYCLLSFIFSYFTTGQTLLVIGLHKSKIGKGESFSKANIFYINNAH
jgi:hypothetical protein